MISQENSMHPFSPSPSDELQAYIQSCSSVLDLVDHMNLMFLTLESEIAWINHFAISYYFADTHPTLIGKPLSDFQAISPCFEIMLKNAKLLEEITLPRIQFETKNVNKLGETTVWSASYIFNEQGASIGILLTGRVHSLKGTEKQKVDYLQGCLDTIIDTVPGSVYWKNQQGVYLGCNRAMVEKANVHSKQDIIGKTDLELWPDYAKEMRKRDEEVMASDATIESQEVVRINTNEDLYFATPIQH